MTSFTTIVDTGSDQSYMPAEALWGWYGAIDGVIYDEGGYCYVRFLFYAPPPPHLGILLFQFIITS